MALWTKAYRDRLPDKAFLFIDKTGKRAFPVYDARGALSFRHLMAAKIQLSKAAGLSCSKKGEISRKISQLEEKTRNDPRNFKYVIVVYRRTKSLSKGRALIKGYATSKKEALAYAREIGGVVYLNKKHVRR
jgi:hypothetical protein